MSKQEHYACPCCGYLTLAEEPPGTYEVCPVCFWEDDVAQGEDPNLEGGANAVSLVEARENFAECGATAREHMGEVRKPRPEESPSAEA